MNDALGTSCVQILGREGSANTKHYVAIVFVVRDVLQVIGKQAEFVANDSTVVAWNQGGNHGLTNAITMKKILRETSPQC